MIKAHQEDAEASGARIVHACGFDSIPSDLGVLFLQTQALKRFGHPMTDVKLRVRSIRGGASGGTVASILNVIEEIREQNQPLADSLQKLVENYRFDTLQKLLDQV